MFNPSIVTNGEASDGQVANRRIVEQGKQEFVEAVDALVETARRCQGVLGSRLVGGGFGGCTITLVRQEDAEPATREIVTRYAKLQGYEPWHHLLGPTDAVCEVFDS